MHRRKHKIKQPIIGAYILSPTGNQEAITIYWSKSHRWECSHLKSFSSLITQLLCFDCGFRCLVPCFQYFGVNRIDSYNCSPNHNHMALNNHDYLSLFFLGSVSRTHNGFVEVYASWYRFMNKLYLPFSLHARVQSQSHCDYRNHMPPSGKNKWREKKDDLHQNDNNHIFQVKKKERQNDIFLFCEMFFDTLNRWNLWSNLIIWNLCFPKG